MTDNQLQDCFTEGRLPRSEEDKLIDRIMSFYPSITLLLAFALPLMPFVDNQTTFPLYINIIGIGLALTLGFYTAWLFSIETKLSTIEAKMPDEGIMKLALEVLNEIEFQVVEDNRVLVGLKIGRPISLMLKFTVLADSGNLFYNCQTLPAKNATVFGRFPFAFGAINKCEREFQQLVQKRLKDSI